MPLLGKLLLLAVTSLATGVPTRTILDVAEELGATEFIRLLDKAGLAQNLTDDGIC